MAQDEHSHYREQLSAYALGALDAEDLRALEDHLQTCDSCPAELAEYRAISDGLLTALPPRSPSAALRKRLQSQLPSAQKKTRPRFTWSFGKLALGGALALLLLMNLFSFLQMRQIQNQQAGLAAADQDQPVCTFHAGLPKHTGHPDRRGQPVRVGAARSGAEYCRAGDVASAPAQSRSNLSGLADRTGRASRQCRDIPFPRRTHPIRHNLFTPSRILANFVGIGVTVEPAGGSDQPTGQRVFKVDLAA